jgi:hypothetical protein
MSKSEDQTPKTTNHEMQQNLQANNTPEDQSDYGVGYCKPPKHTQFKKGKSGNPKGRPPNKDLHEAIIYILNEMVTVHKDGKSIEMTQKEAIIYRIITDSMKGKSTATKNLIYLLKNLPWIHPF